MYAFLRELQAQKIMSLQKDVNLSNWDYDEKGKRVFSFHG